MFGVDDPEVVARVRVYVKLMRARRSVTARIYGYLSKRGLTTTQLGVLEALLHKGPLTHRDLSRKVLTSAGNMSDVIDKLERRGLVARTPCPTDRRQVLVVLTPDGEATIKDIFPAHAGDIAAAMSSLDAGELETLEHLLRKLGRGAEAGGPDAAGALAGAAPPTHLAGQSFDVERSGERDNET
jgi:MarR family 2-MHQ and catechol resistance regulon transcriptional repressor